MINKPENPKNLKTSSKNLGFSSPGPTRVSVPLSCDRCRWNQADCWSRKKTALGDDKTQIKTNTERSFTISTHPHLSSASSSSPWTQELTGSITLWYPQKSVFTISVARIFCLGVRYFLSKKLTTFFLVVALKDCLNLPQNLSHVAKTVLKIDSCAGWGCTSCPEGALTHFSCKLSLNIFFHRPGVQVHPLHPLATPMVSTTINHGVLNFSQVMPKASMDLCTLIRDPCKIAVIVLRLLHVK